jgi:tungstate transport system substrate-binding protein
MRRLVGLGIALALIAFGCGSADSPRIVVAAGTTVVDSGLMERLVDAYRETGIDVDLSVVGAGTGEALALAAAGSADLVVAHQRDLEEAFLAEHPKALVEPIFSSTFLLVGPPDGSRSNGRTITELFAEIAADAVPFVTRRDESGSYAKEREIWALTGVDPVGEDWYIETGQGMGFTLQVADQRSAYALAEEGAYRTIAGEFSLVPIDVEAPPGLLENPYRAIVVDPDSGSAALEFVAWLRSDAGRRALIEANQEFYGEIVYSPAP